jgi:HK97 family phage prohead protease
LTIANRTGADDGDPDAELRSSGLHVRAGSVKRETRTASFVASSDAIDSYDEIVEQQWDLKRFKSNPIVLYAHNSRELPIGKAVDCKMVDGNLECTLEFADAEANPKAEQVFRLIEGGFLKAVSVGFVPRDVRKETRGGKDVYVLSNNELHEISVVPIPANPEALAKIKAKAKAGAERTAKGKTMLTEAEVEALKSNIAEREATIATFPVTEKALADERTKTAALELQIKALGDERDALRADKAALAASVIASEVEALVGKKITPAEKDAFVELATSNHALFEKMVGQRGDLGLVGAPVIAPEADPVRSLDVKSGGDELVGLALDAAQNESL